MKPKTVEEAELVILALQDEIRRTQEARYDHRLHAVLLVAQGMSCRGVAGVLGDAPRTVAYWLKRFEEEGLSGLTDADKSGRPGRLSKKQMKRISEAIRKAPEKSGLAQGAWDGKTLSAFIESKFEITLGVRQCQRLFRQMGFRLRKPRPVIAKADAQKQAEYKKN